MLYVAGLNEGKATSLHSIGSAGTKVHLHISGIIVPDPARTIFGGMSHANVSPSYQIPVLPPGPAADLFNLVAQSHNSPIFGGAPVKLSVRVPTPIESQENEKEHSDIHQGNSIEEARQTSMTAAVDSGSPNPKGGQRWEQCYLLFTLVKWKVLIERSIEISSSWNSTWNL